MDAQVVRWRKYGNDRLYVTAGDGTKLGHHDLLTGLDHLAEGEQAVAFHSALAPCRRDGSRPGGRAEAGRAGTDPGLASARRTHR